MKPRNDHYALVHIPYEYCGKTVLTMAWERTVFCHGDCADNWLVELRFGHTS